jgi:hypothetical protein
MCDLYFEYSVAASVALLCAACGGAIGGILRWQQIFNSWAVVKVGVWIGASVALALCVDACVYRRCMLGDSPGPGDGFKFILLAPIAGSIWLIGAVLGTYFARRKRPVPG